VAQRVLRTVDKLSRPPAGWHVPHADLLESLFLYNVSDLSLASLERTEKVARQHSATSRVTNTVPDRNVSESSKAGNAADQQSLTTYGYRTCI
jgi:hypothetical protein